MKCILKAEAVWVCEDSWEMKMRMDSSRNDLPHERHVRSRRRLRDEPKDRGRPGEVVLKSETPRSFEKVASAVNITREVSAEELGTMLEGLYRGFTFTDLDNLLSQYNIYTRYSHF